MYSSVFFVNSLLCALKDFEQDGEENESDPDILNDPVNQIDLQVCSVLTILLYIDFAGYITIVNISVEYSSVFSVVALAAIFRDIGNIMWVGVPFSRLWKCWRISHCLKIGTLPV